jgi:dTDP-4-amino-4,6-dideoxygalactose transaminase
MSISFNRPTFVGKESEYMQEALKNNHISGDGQFTKKSHALLEERSAFPSFIDHLCTHAPNVALL